MTDPIQTLKALRDAKEELNNLWNLIEKYCPNVDDLHLSLGGFIGEVKTAIDQAITLLEARQVDV